MTIKYCISRLIILSVALTSCSSINDKKVDAITPGLGEYMAMIEYHQLNLSKAIVDKNYKRANYELDELMEVFEKTQQLHNNHEKLVSALDKTLPSLMYAPIIDLRKSIKIADTLQLKNGFKILTQNCNSCHSMNKMEFIEIK